LFVPWQVKTVEVAQGLVDGRVALIAHHGQDGIAGREVADDEGEKGDAHQHERETEQTADDDREHFGY
jgi:hypothetical protein